MDVIEGILSNLNTWLVMFIVGIVVWVIRQILPVKVEKMRVWKVLLQVVPVLLGAGVALIPGLQPIPENLAQSAAIGMIGGSFAQTAYGLLRQIVGERLKAKLGSRSARLNKVSEEE